MTDIQLLSEIKTLLSQYSFTGKETLTVKEASIFSGYSESKLYRLRAEKKVLSFNPEEGKIFFDKSSLEKYMRQNPQATDEDMEVVATNFSNRRAS